MSNDIETEKTQSQQSAESQIEVHRKRSILQKLSILWTIVSVLFSIGFMFFGLFSKWGNTKYFFVLLSIVCAYIVIFIVFIWFLTKKDKTTLLELQCADEKKNAAQIRRQEKRNKKRVKRSVADFKSGLSIIKSLLNLLYVVMTITVMVGAASMIDVHAVFAWIVIVISLVFSVLKLSFGIALLVFKRIILPKMAKKGSYTLYSVVGGKVTESKRINGLLKKLSAKFKKED